MSDYRQEGTGKVVTEEKVAKLAKAGGYTIEEYVEAAKLTLITSDPDKPDFQKGSATGADVLSEVKEAPMGTVLDSVDISSDLPEIDPVVKVDTATEIDPAVEVDATTEIDPSGRS